MLSYDVATGKETTTPAPNGPYVVGDTFESPDGCNDCSCSEKGTMCTTRSCGGQPGPGGGCLFDAMECPDGTYVGRSGPNCEFVCPEPNECTADAKRCPDGTSVGAPARTVSLRPAPDPWLSAAGRPDPTPSFRKRVARSSRRRAVALGARNEAAERGR